MPERDALDAIDAAWDAGIRYFDTAPWYGRGLSELRTGAGLRYRPRDEYILSTKIGRWLKAPGPGSSIRTCRRGRRRPPSTSSSTTRTTASCALRAEPAAAGPGLVRRRRSSTTSTSAPRARSDRLQHYFAQLATSGWRAIEELSAHGLLKAIGAGINDLGLIPRFLDIVDLDFFLIAMPYTLLRQEMLDEEFPACVERGIGFVIGAPYQSGILAAARLQGRRMPTTRRRPGDVATGASASRPSARAMACPSRRPRSSS